MAGPTPRYRDSAHVYLRAVAQQWFAIVGGVVPAVIAVIAGSFGVQVPRWVWVMTMILGFLVAQFLAFHNQQVRHQIELERLHVEMRPAKPPKKAPDPAHDRLIRALHPLFEQSRFLMRRRAAGRQFDTPGFGEEVRSWAAEVSAALEGFPHYKQQFDSEPGFRYSMEENLSKSATLELEHRVRMLQLIVESALRK